MKSRVVLIPCASYEKEQVYEKLKKGLALLGGPERFARKEEKVLLKLNLVRGARAERAVTTHPAVAEGLARIFREQGYRHLAAGDSSGFGSSIKIMQELGLAPAFEKYGVEMKEFREAVRTEYPEGVHAKQFMLAGDVLEADALISVCKMKTHALEYITGAVKNQYGCVQGFHKAKGHTLYSDPVSFARMLGDLNRLVKPRLYVMDGITAMEGNGPTSGDPVQMGLLLLSEDPVALDSVFCRLVYLDPELVPTNVQGERMGLGTWRTENIGLLTEEGPVELAEAVQRFGNPGFRVKRKPRPGQGLDGSCGDL